MAKFYGAVGYIEDVETSPDVHVEKPIERMYKGDLVSNSRSLQSNDYLNGKVTISNEISIIADAYAYNHIFAMRYVKWMGAAWEVTKVKVERPRLILSLGGVYNGELAEKN